MCLFLLFFAAELLLILQRLILLYRPLRFSDRISIIDCNFGNTWRVFGVKLIDKIARTTLLPLTTFVSVSLNLPNFFINELDLTTNNGSLYTRA